MTPDERRERREAIGMILVLLWAAALCFLSCCFP